MQRDSSSLCWEPVYNISHTWVDVLTVHILYHLESYAISQSVEQRNGDDVTFLSRLSLVMRAGFTGMTPKARYFLYYVL
jgi:hypothetical protein